MCGINGIALSSRSGRRVDASVVERMRDVLAHRGPDDVGLYFDGRVGLGHRRLSIVDVSRGHQPMTNEDGTLHVVYNGEVYNHADYRASLEARAVAPEVNYAALPDYLANHAPSGEETLFVGVKRLLPGHTMTWRDGELKIRQFWDVSFGAGEDET